jgi:hypothetical protein
MSRATGFSFFDKASGEVEEAGDETVDAILVHSSELTKTLELLQNHGYAISLPFIIASFPIAHSSKLSAPPQNRVYDCPSRPTFVCH